MAEDLGWKKEVLQLRKNHNTDSAQVRDLMTMLENMVPVVKSAHPYPANFSQFCLAMHHFSMNFGTTAQKATLKHATCASLSELPQSFGDFGLKEKKNG